MRLETLTLEPESPMAPGGCSAVSAAVVRPWWKTAAAARFAALTLLICGLVVIMIVVHPTRHTLLRMMGPHDAFGPVIAVGGAAVLTAALVPRTLLSAVGGLFFGWAPGTLYVLAGVLAGSALAYGVGRLLGHEFMARYLRGRLLRVERAVAGGGILPVVVSRMIPLIPFGIANYIFGTTSVRFRNFILGTVIGALPATLAYAALGSATAHGNHPLMIVCGSFVAVLGIGGSIGTYFIWRRRPRTIARQHALAAS
jgi:uncharacterized membrane protein YdjX (TVP38/TMEM64 family)